MRRKSCCAGILALLCAAETLVGADFTVINTASVGPGSLHQAITDANASAGADRIVFNIPGSGVRKIDLSATSLPRITDTLAVDGYTQPGAAPNSLPVGNNAVILIHLDGGGAPDNGRDGLFITASGSSLRGLCLSGFLGGGTTSSGGSAVVLGGSARDCIVAGNFFGVLPDGVTRRSNTTAVWQFEIGPDTAAVNTLGGTDPAARNVISGSVGNAIAINGNLIVSGNYIGTDASGTKAVPNATGILLAGSVRGTLIGGTETGAGNLISGNTVGISIGGVAGSRLVSADGVRIKGNTITANGSSLVMYGGTSNVIGGLEPGAGNVVTLNGSGLKIGLAPASGVPPTLGNRVLSNLIYSNGDLPIDLDSDGATSNDLGDDDRGSNNRQNFPIITSAATASGGSISQPNGSVKGSLNSAPNADFTLQFFRYNVEPRLLGTMVVRTNAAGIADFTFFFYDPEPAKDGSYYTATATDAQGNTSEFMPQNGPVQLANISTRGFVGTDANILIGGFIVRSDQPKRLGVRALGPSINLPNRLQDPYLELYDGNGALLAQNDDWRTGQQQEITSAGLAPSSDVESALITTLPAGNYTAQVSGVNGRTGVGIVEVYDLDNFTATSGRLVNISTRGAVGTGDNVLIGGLIVRGDAAARVVARAIGPDLQARSVADALQDPTLELRDANGDLVAENDNWRENQNEQVPAGLEPGDDRDSVIVLTVAPAPYTAIMRGKDGTTGVALIEFYDLKN